MHEKRSFSYSVRESESNDILIHSVEFSNADNSDRSSKLFTFTLLYFTFIYFTLPCQWCIKLENESLKLTTSESFNRNGYTLPLASILEGPFSLILGG